MLTIEKLSKAYRTADNERVGGVRDVDLDVASGEFFTLLGPSGCGKTTTLRSVAGLEEPSVGRIIINGVVVFDSETGVNLAANRRNIGMVFQSYAVWPHMSVFENVAFPLRMSRTPSAKMKALVGKALETVGLEEYASRSAAQLSGGQQQRLALARALVSEPRLLLLDEPLSNLDAKLRDQMRIELRRLQKDLGVTTLYVTHDQSEALALSDRIAVMQAGQTMQIGTPKEIYYRPNSTFVASFVGQSNVLSGVAVSGASKPGDKITVETAVGLLTCLSAEHVIAGQKVAAMIRPEFLHVAAPTSAAENLSDVNKLNGRILSSSFMGEVTEYRLVVDNGPELVARALRSDESPASEAVLVSVPHEHVLAIPTS